MFTEEKVIRRLGNKLVEVLVERQWELVTDERLFTRDDNFDWRILNNYDGSICWCH